MVGFLTTLKTVVVALGVAGLAIPNPGIEERDILVKIDMVQSAEDKPTCHPLACYDACYQRGGYVDGICEPDGKCNCISPEEPEDPDDGKNKQHAMSAWEPPISTKQGLCKTYADCGFCGFYQRCCFTDPIGPPYRMPYGHCMCGGSGQNYDNYANCL